MEILLDGNEDKDPWTKAVWKDKGNEELGRCQDEDSWEPISEQ